MKTQRSRVTRKQLEVVKLIDEGLTSFQIGERMGIRENTVNSHRQNVMRLLDVDNAKDLVSKCYTENLLK